jgi:DNA-directed RNA polymerase subunit RPC12/RpoP
MIECFPDFNCWRTTVDYLCHNCDALIDMDEIVKLDETVYVCQKCLDEGLDLDMLNRTEEEKFAALGVAVEKTGRGNASYIKH